MPSTASSTTASSSSILALSTPFVQPTTCTNIFTTSILAAIVRNTNIISRSTVTDTTVVQVTVTVSDPADPRFTTCQPPGWADVVPESRFAFSPAVCPSGWTMYNLRTYGPVSTADCCASGYSAARPEWATGVGGLQTGTPGCFKRVNVPRASGALDTFPGPVDVQVHNAYHVSWQASDTATLTPQPPAITCTYGMDMWVPGSPVTSTACITPAANDSAISPRVGQFIVIGVPIIVCAVVFGFVGCYCYGYRKGKREQRIKAAARAQAARERDDRNYSRALASADQS